MNTNDISELKKQYTPDRFSPRIIRGCYTDSKKEIVSLFRLDPQTISRDELDHYALLFRKALSGMPAQTLHTVSFAPHATDSDEFRLLSALREDCLFSDDTCEILYRRIIDCLQMEGAYVILLVSTGFDSPSHFSYKAETDKDSVFSCFQCIICPVKLSKSVLAYSAADNTFHGTEPDWIISSPALGFVYPAYEGGSANLYGALYYAKDKTDLHDELIQGLFASDAPACPTEQKNRFASLLEDTLQEECSLDVLQTMHGDIRERIAENKSDREAEPLEFNGTDVKHMLSLSGVSPDHAEAFEKGYNEIFPKGSAAKAVNILEPRQFQITAPNVVIKVDPEHTDLIETRVINGIQYLLVRADENVEVNGIKIRF